MVVWFTAPGTESAFSMNTDFVLLGYIAVTYVDAAYCYRRSSVVCRSVSQSVTIVSPAKAA